jgi:hypothetical protein
MFYAAPAAGIPQPFAYDSGPRPSPQAFAGGQPFDDDSSALADLIDLAGRRTSDPGEDCLCSRRGEADLRPSSAPSRRRVVH